MTWLTGCVQSKETTMSKTDITPDSVTIKGVE
jgi:hypothetical protein